MSLNELWFILIAVLFTGFFFLEGFDFGVGMSTRFLARNDQERRILINSIGPFWDANEVWLITAAGAMFAAFPHWYATMFSGYYLLFTIILLGLIFRGVAFEFRGKVNSGIWRSIWDGAIWIGSLVPPLLLGVVFASMVKGVPIGENMQMHAAFSDMVNGYSLLGGVVVVALCLLHGLAFIGLRTTGELRIRTRMWARRVMPVSALLLAAFYVWTWLDTTLFAARPWLAILVGILAAVATLIGFTAFGSGREKLAFLMSGSLILLMFALLFASIAPTLMVSSLDAAFNLTIYNASSGDYTLKAMTIVTIILLPIVLAYQVWSYVVFHKRITAQDHLEY